ncbi:hypothetical protein NL676_034830 [Syzygium grande]|nr:hypothetical protein NL676_034830 [Syzygium grande]
MEGLSPYEKLVGALFEAVNTRHAGESVFDLSIISPAILTRDNKAQTLEPHAQALNLVVDTEISGVRLRNPMLGPKKPRAGPWILELATMVMGLNLILGTQTQEYKIGDPGSVDTRS